MANRLQHLRAKAHVTVDPLLAENATDEFSSFWSQFNEIQSSIFQISEIVDQIAQLDDALGNSFGSEAEGIRNELNDKIKSVPSAANRVRMQLEQIRTEVKNIATAKSGTAEARLQQNHLQMLDEEFTSTVARFTSLQEEIKSKFRDQVVRQAAVAGDSLDPKHVEEVLERDPDYFQQNLFKVRNDSRTREAVELYSEIYHRHQDIIEIDRMLNELLETFVQFSILVKDQGRMIDNIESNVASAKEYVQKGTQQLIQAQQSQKKSRKCLWWIVIACIVILIGVVILLVFVLK